jgi:hypothetical protein
MRSPADYWKAGGLWTGSNIPSSRALDDDTGAVADKFDMTFPL